MIEITDYTPAKTENIRRLILSVFDTFVGIDYSQQGKETFYKFIDSEDIIKRVSANSRILLAENEIEIVGMIEPRDNNHISLSFVDSRYHNQGIGKILLNTKIATVKDKTEFIEVNSSPYAVSIYEKLGFQKTDEPKEIDGILFIPMKRALV
jgi:ribosomal protein S18 acetylase RimI-like enzyme